MSKLFGRFWKKVEVRTKNQCWPWLGAKERFGHGRFKLNTKSAVYAHRLSYEIENGPIPDGACVCHSCDNPSCVNPNHLWLGTRGDNNRDRATKGRSYDNRGENHNQAILNNNSVKSIRKRFLDGEAQTALAKEYGVSIAAINMICKHKTWKHI